MISLRFLVVHPFFDGEKLASRLFDHLCLHLFRQNRQILRAPSGISLVQLLRLLERNQMAERPCDHIAAADQAVFSPVALRPARGQCPARRRVFRQRRAYAWLHLMSFTAPLRPAGGWQSACIAPARPVSPCPAGRCAVWPQSPRRCSCPRCWDRNIPLDAGT